jgi:hypothetical protein
MRNYVEIVKTVAAYAVPHTPFLVKVWSVDEAAVAVS